MITNANSNIRKILHNALPDLYSGTFAALTRCSFGLYELQDFNDANFIYNNIDNIKKCFEKNIDNLYDVLDEIGDHYIIKRNCSALSDISKVTLRNEFKDYLNELCPDGYLPDYKWEDYKDEILQNADKEVISDELSKPIDRVKAINLYHDVVEQAINNILYDGFENVLDTGERKINNALYLALKNQQELPKLSDQECISILLENDNVDFFGEKVAKCLSFQFPVNPFNHLNDFVQELAYNKAMEFIAETIKELGITRFDRDAIEDIRDMELSINKIDKITSYHHTLEWAGDIAVEMNTLSSKKFKEEFDTDKNKFSDIKKKQISFATKAGKDRSDNLMHYKYEYPSLRDLNKSNIDFFLSNSDREFIDNIRFVNMVNCKVDGKPVNFSDLNKEQKQEILKDIINNKTSGTINFDVLGEKQTFNNTFVGKDYTITIEPTKDFGIYKAECFEGDKKDMSAGIYKIDFPKINSNVFGVSDVICKYNNAKQADIMDLTIDDFNKKRSFGKLSFFNYLEEINVKISFTRSYRNAKNMADYYRYFNPDKIDFSTYNSIGDHDFPLNSFTDRAIIEMFNKMKDSASSSYDNKEINARFYISSSSKPYLSDYIADKTDCYDFVIPFGSVVVDKIKEEALNGNENATIFLSDVLKEKVNFLKFENIDIYTDGTIEGNICDEKYNISFTYDLKDNSIEYHNYDPGSYDVMKEEYTKELPLPYAFKSTTHLNILKEYITDFCKDISKDVEFEVSIDDKLSKAEEKASIDKDSKSIDEMEI